MSPEEKSTVTGMDFMTPGHPDRERGIAPVGLMNQKNEDGKVAVMAAIAILLTKADTDVASTDDDELRRDDQAGSSFERESESEWGDDDEELCSVVPTSGFRAAARLEG